MQFEPFDFRTVTFPLRWRICGPRQSGKTTFLLHLLFLFRTRFKFVEGNVSSSSDVKRVLCSMSPSDAEFCFVSDHEPLRMSACVSEVFTSQTFPQRYDEYDLTVFLGPLTLSICEFLYLHCCRSVIGCGGIPNGCYTQQGALVGADSFAQFLANCLENYGAVLFDKKSRVLWTCRFRETVPVFRLHGACDEPSLCQDRARLLSLIEALEAVLIEALALTVVSYIHRLIHPCCAHRIV